MDCTVHKTLEIISKRWSFEIILSIYKSKENKKRYSEIKKNLKPITPKILSTRLKELEKNNIIKNTIDSSKVPIKSYYELTESGKGLIKIIKDVKSWGLKFKFNNKLCENSNCKECTL